jgi:lysophospholipase L1-like esterase
VRFWLHTAALVVAMLVGFEVLCRIALGHLPQNRVDPRYDSIPQPDEPVVESTEGFGRARTNELGHLDAAMPRVLPADGILVIGDSLTEGRQVALEDRFTDLAGTTLARRVYNVGHTGWSPLNAIAFLRAERATFSPATVIVQVSGNDLEDMVAARRPHLVERNGSFDFVLPDRDKKGFAKTINRVKNFASRSALAGELISSALTMFGQGDGGPGETTCEAPKPLAIRALPWVIGELRAAHPDVRLLYLPLLDYHADCTDRCSDARVVFERAARDANVPFIDTTSALCERFRNTRQPMHGFWNSIPGTGHLNADGHRVVAETLVAHLRTVAHR